MKTFFKMNDIKWWNRKKKQVQKKMMLTCVNFLNTWLELLNRKYLILKNHEAQLSTNQMLKDKILKKINYTKWFKKIEVKKMRT